MVFLCQNTMINSSCALANKDKNFPVLRRKKNKIVPFLCLWKARLKNSHWYAAHDFVFNLYFEIGSGGALCIKRRAVSMPHKSLVYWAQGEVCLSLESVWALKPKTWSSEPGLLFVSHNRAPRGSVCCWVLLPPASVGEWPDVNGVEKRKNRVTVWCEYVSWDI